MRYCLQAVSQHLFPCQRIVCPSVACCFPLVFMKLLLRVHEPWKNILRWQLFCWYRPLRLALLVFQRPAQTGDRPLCCETAL